MPKTYSTYITTNPERQVLYVGVTNDLARRILEHYHKRGTAETFAARFFCYNLLYYEDYYNVREAISRETQIKSWSRYKKDRLIRTTNKDWKFLNAELFDCWPP